MNCVFEVLLHFMSSDELIMGFSESTWERLLSRVSYTNKEEEVQYTLGI